MAEPGCLHDAHFQNLEASGDTIVKNISVSENTKNINRSLKTTDRYYLEEWFHQRPCDNNDLANAGEATRVPANRNFEVLGTNMTSALCTFPTHRAGILITTAGANNDQAIIAPHLDTNQTAWSGVKWGTENQVEWECCISIADITSIKVWAGLKLTNTHLSTDDADQVFFKFQTANEGAENFSALAKLHFIHSIGGDDRTSELPITVAANTNYHLKIVIDKNRQASIFVNGIQYNITGGAASPDSVSVTAGTTKSAALTDDVDLIPYIGVTEKGTGAARSLNVYYQAINRVLFE